MSEERRPCGYEQEDAGRCPAECRRFCSLPVPRCLSRENRILVARHNDELNAEHARERTRLARVRAEPPSPSEVIADVAAREFERRVWGSR